MSHTTMVTAVLINDIPALRAAVRELERNGINVELVEKAQPRMFYPDQLQKHCGQKSEICDYIVKVKDANYDIGLIKDDKGNYVPVFDDWGGSIKRNLGVDPSSVTRIDGPVKEVNTTGGWGRDSQDPHNLMCSIGKFSQAYTKHATMNFAASKGYRVNGATVTKEGKVQLLLAV